MDGLLEDQSIFANKGDYSAILQDVDKALQLLQSAREGISLCEIYRNEPLCRR